MVLEWRGCVVVSRILLCFVGRFWLRGSRYLQKLLLRRVDGLGRQRPSGFVLQRERCGKR